MSDLIAGFPLRGASQEDLGVALGRSFADYSAWHGEANFVANFGQDARTSCVTSVVADRIRVSLDLGEAMGVIIASGDRTTSNDEIARSLAEYQVTVADHGGKIAAIVMLHNACERFLWRLVRFGLVADRIRVLGWIADRKVTINMLASQGRDELINAQIEKWWDELERDTMAKKWDRLVALVGFPGGLTHAPWHFDRDMLLRFDDVRHDAVHHNAGKVRTFDFFEFARQLFRAQHVWLVHIAVRLNLTIPAESFFFGR
jgi:hypothetical protein